MMTVVPYKAEHLLEMVLQPGQEYALPFVTPEHAKALEGEYAFTALVDGRPIAVGGVKELWKNRALCWTFIDRNAGKHFAELHRTVKRLIDLVPYRRLEAETPCDFKQGHRWLKMLGFKLEAERMRAFQIDGSDSSLYAKVR